MICWMDIKDSPGFEISEEGKVRNKNTGRILKTHLNRPGGCERVTINGKKRYIHRLVADNFFGCGVEDGDRVVHTDKNNQNNRPKNLKIIKKSAHK